MNIDKFAQDIKDKINIKMELINNKNAVLERIKKGRLFFEQAEEKQTSPVKIAEAVTLIINLQKELAEIDQNLLDTDIIIATMLEAYLSDSVIRFTSSKKTNDAGDSLEVKKFAFVPYKEMDNIVEITPDELWFLKIVKQAIKYTNTEVISKEEYYK